MSRRAFCAWLAIVALLIDALTPSAVQAARTGARSGASVLCGAATGIPLPGKEPPALPNRHCALCACPAIGLAPPRSLGKT